MSKLLERLNYWSVYGITWFGSPKIKVLPIILHQTCFFQFFVTSIQTVSNSYNTFRIHWQLYLYTLMTNFCRADLAQFSR